MKTSSGPASVLQHLRFATTKILAVGLLGLAVTR